MGFSTDAHGKPVFSATPTQTVADLQAGADYADTIGGLLKGTAGDRDLLTAGELVPGWLFTETDTDRIYLWTGSGWDLVHVKDTGTVVLSPSSGWAAYSSGVQVRAVNRVAYLTINATRASWTGPATVAVLPVGFRPPFRVPFLSAYADVAKECYVNTDGTIQVNANGTNGVTGSVAFPID